MNIDDIILQPSSGECSEHSFVRYSFHSFQTIIFVFWTHKSVWAVRYNIRVHWNESERLLWPFCSVLFHLLLDISIVKETIFAWFTGPSFQISPTSIKMLVRDRENHEETTPREGNLKKIKRNMTFSIISVSLSF